MGIRLLLDPGVYNLQLEFVSAYAEAAVVIDVASGAVASAATGATGGQTAAASPNPNSNPATGQ